MEIWIRCRIAFLYVGVCIQENEYLGLSRSLRNDGPIAFMARVRAGLGGRADSRPSSSGLGPLLLGKRRLSMSQSDKKREARGEKRDPILLFSADKNINNSN